MISVYLLLDYRGRTPGCPAAKPQGTVAMMTPGKELIERLKNTRREGRRKRKSVTTIIF